MFVDPPPNLSHCSLLLDLVFCEDFFLFFSFRSIFLDGVPRGFSEMPYYCRVGGIRLAGKYHRYYYYFDIATSTVDRVSYHILYHLLEIKICLALYEVLALEYCLIWRY